MIHKLLHVVPVLETALAHGGCRYTLESYAKAVRWRQQAYKYRRLLSIESGGPTKYDQLIIQLPKKGAPFDNVVTLKIETFRGKLETLDGRPAAPPAAPPVDDDLDFIEDLIEEHGE